MHQRIVRLSRRGKYLLLHMPSGTLIVHLGMSGSLCIVPMTTTPQTHAHVDIVFSATHLLRYHDPRRFGAILWTEAAPLQHPLLQPLGVEPLDSAFTGEYLYQRATRRSVAIKAFIMNSHIVTGIGNIYAAEALFLARIHPETSVSQLAVSDFSRLVCAIQQVLHEAIQQGGTTIKDFVNSLGKPGYFVQKLNVYGRKGKPCHVCGTALQSMVMGQRSTVYCAHCQAAPASS